MKSTGKALSYTRIIISLLPALALIPVFAVVVETSRNLNSKGNRDFILMFVGISMGLSLINFALGYAEKLALKKHEREEEHKEKQALIDRVKELEEKISQTEE